MRHGLLNSCAAAAFALAGSMAATAAFAADVSLDDVAVKQSDPDAKVVIKHVDVKNSSLSADDVKKLLSGDLSDADETALAKTFKADSVTISEVDSTGPKVNVAVKNIVATGVDSGKVDKLDVAGADIKPEEGGGHAGALHAENLNLGPLMDAVEHKKHFGGTGLTSLTFEGLDMQFPLEDMPKDAPGGRLGHITVGQIAFKATYDGDLPIKSDVSVKGIVVQFPDGSKEAAGLKSFGLDKVQVDFHGASTCDKAAKTCAIADVTYNVANLVSLSVTGDFANWPIAIDTGDKASAMAAMMQVQVADLQIKLVNSGLYEKGTDFAAASKHMSGQMLRSSMPMMAMMVPQMIGDPVAGKKVGDALNAFFKDPKSLTISIKAKGAPVAISDLVANPSPAAIFGKLTLDASADK